MKEILDMPMMAMLGVLFLALFAIVGLGIEQYLQKRKKTHPH